jgi:hypothetical protein
MATIGPTALLGTSSGGMIFGKVDPPLLHNHQEASVAVWSWAISLAIY